MEAASRCNKRNQAQNLVNKYIATRHHSDENQVILKNSV